LDKERPLVMETGRETGLKGGFKRKGSPLTYFLRIRIGKKRELEKGGKGCFVQKTGGNRSHSRCVVVGEGGGETTAEETHGGKEKKKPSMKPKKRKELPSRVEGGGSGRVLFRPQNGGGRRKGATNVAGGKRWKSFPYNGFPELKGKI